MIMFEEFKGKVLFVTGAASGMGRAVAVRFGSLGCKVAVAARRPDAGEETVRLVKEAGGEAIFVSCDVSRDESVKAAIDTFGRIDVLVNNAGIADKHRPITRCDADWWDHVIKVDQYSVYYMMKEALVYMEQAGSGSIINISSIGGTGYCAGISYSAAKTAVISMSKNVGIQFAGTGIRCNVVAPGPTPTELNTPEAIATFDGEFAAQCARHFDDTVPEVTVDDQANAILFFASDESKGCNGQVLIVDNGRTI